MRHNDAVTTADTSATPATVEVAGLGWPPETGVSRETSPPGAEPAGLGWPA